MECQEAANIAYERRLDRMALWMRDDNAPNPPTMSTAGPSSWEALDESDWSICAGFAISAMLKD